MDPYKNDFVPDALTDEDIAVNKLYYIPVTMKLI